MQVGDLELCCSKYLCWYIIDAIDLIAYLQCLVEAGG